MLENRYEYTNVGTIKERFVVLLLLLSVTMTMTLFLADKCQVGH